MDPQYTAQRIKDTTTGWVLTEVESGETHIVFCNVNANTAEDAAALLLVVPSD
jgi:hypothetical protein